LVTNAGSVRLSAALSNIEPTPFGDKYVLVEHIATGGMAEIYRAHYAGIEGFAKELVVKTLRDEFAARPEVVGMFLDEARVAATLTHNNVVHTYDLGEIGGEYFIAMELLKGEELVNVMRRGHQLERPLSRELAIGIIMQSCEGLHYVHSRVDDRGRNLGLVHRDINPTNIHVGYDGVCKILDFGIAATRASAVAKKGQVAGKLSYMAPEQLRGDAIDMRADIFPLGVVMYELLLGRRLFRGNREDVTRRVLEGDIPPPTFVDPSFPPALEAVIMKALEVDPADRYQNCDHMFRDLDAWLQEEKLAWTARKLSAVMVDLFGEGAPARVDYEDQYDDLVDDALDFAAFESVAGADVVDDEAPDWARGLSSGGGESKKKKSVAIGNLEALVNEGKFDQSGPHPPVPPAEVFEPAQAGRRPKSRPEIAARSGTHKAVPREESAPRRSPTARHRAGTGSRPGILAVPARPGTGSHDRVGTGPLQTINDGAGSFGQSVVSERSKKGPAAWAWVLGLLAVSGVAWMAYTLFTSK
jgi:tRNA A-37 threonylcarbamoyl transferase component Bud32